jgi:tripartite-type tricarboxylate transporter receptor subunit TctC
MVVPVPPSAAPDLAGRLLAEGLARRRGHPLAVENRAGADGVIGAEAFVQTRPGEALFYSFVAAVTVSPLLHEGRLPFDPEADLVPISTGAADFFVLSVSPTLPVRTLAEFVEHARGRPAALNWFASPGAPYLAFRAFLRDAGPGGIDMAYVSYRGTPPALVDLAAGRIQAALTPMAAVLPLARDGRARLLVLTGPERVATLPDLPTTAEAGMPEFLMEGLQGLFGWRGMPEAARDELSAQVREILGDPTVAERFRAAGMTPRGSTPAEFARELAQHRARWAALAREFGAKPPRG